MIPSAQTPTPFARRRGSLLPNRTGAATLGAAGPSFECRTGLLGGSFNPAHGGHRRITRFTMDALGLAEAWWLVSPGNPLKPRRDMASLTDRLRSAAAQSRRARIVPTAIERELGTRYTVDTLRRLVRRYPRRRFVWLMGADNLAQFHLWKGWRMIARTMPIAVIARPGYNADAMTSPAMAWLRRYRVSAASFRKRGQWSAPALVFLRFDPDPRSATAIRRGRQDWASDFRQTPLRDRLTFRRIGPSEDA
ncbi:nicotinate-nucleotide adenylyltransferase [Erythrobacter sp. HL-111]|nr:MAG: nicotinate-nucleotide adenylyltransferase NadD [Erythrobacteraceae bacterium HL-111]SDS73526.1 nicotinate-nucleotide adenylyltransferase [Erythrobacter sp. HL-111]